MIKNENDMTAEGYGAMERSLCESCNNESLTCVANANDDGWHWECLNCGTIIPNGEADTGLEPIGLDEEDFQADEEARDGIFCTEELESGEFMDADEYEEVFPDGLGTSEGQGDYA